MVVVITTNYGNPQWVTYDLSNFGVCEGPIERWETNTDGGFKYEHFQDSGEILNQSVSLYFEANTIQTMEVTCL